ncbi:hypothetical protein FHR74_001051 [Sphingomonas aerolata]|nr:hypothetical protein [Sphingomonas aerolata]
MPIMTAKWMQAGLAGALVAGLWLPAPSGAAQTGVAPPAPSPPAPSQIASVDAPQLQLPVDAAMQDAAQYARRFGVPLDVALHRMRAQAATIPVTDALRREFADRLAGIAVEHDPAYRIVVLLTGTDPVADRVVEAGGMSVPLVFRTGAAATLDRILGQIRTFQAAIRAALPHPPGIGADQRTGTLVVMVATADLALDRDGALTAKFADMTGVPVRIEASDRPMLPMALQTSITATPGATAPGIPVATIPPANVVTVMPDVAGGGRVVGTVDGRRYVCTTGFVVTDGVADAIATAAHCPDTLDYVGRPPAGAERRAIALPYVGQWGWGYQDVQINRAPALPATAPRLPAFFADTAKTRLRTVATWRNRTSTRAGDFVCHRGERTGYSCAPVAMVDFAPAGDLCGGACLPTWVAVEGPTCKSGDSGAPVFEGQVALGLVKGGTYRADGSCLFYYYMSTDYLPPGWTLAYR